MIIQFLPGFEELLDKLQFTREKRKNMMACTEQQQQDFMDRYSCFLTDVAARGRLPADAPVLPPRSKSVRGPRDPSKTKTKNIGLTDNSKVLQPSYHYRLPSWYIAKISNRVIELRTLLKYLVSLNLTIELENDTFISSFLLVKATHVGNNGGVDGLGCLELALDRVCPPHLQKQGLSSDQALADEIRSEVIKTMREVLKTVTGANMVFDGKRGLVGQIVWCLAMPLGEGLKNLRVRRGSMVLIASVAQLLGQLCQKSKAVRDEVVAVVQMLKVHQLEPSSFKFLIDSLNNPFEILDLETQRYAGAIEFETLWDYRTKLMVLFNGLLAQDIGKDGNLRKMFEDVKLYEVIEALALQTNTAEFTRQAQEFKDMRRKDMIVREKGNYNACFKLLKAHFGIIGGLKNRKEVSDITTSVLSNMYQITEAIQGSEDLTTILHLIDRTTKSLASNALGWNSSLVSKAEKISKLQDEFYNGAIEVVGYGGKRDKKMVALVETLDDLRAKNRGLFEANLELKKELESYGVESIDDAIIKVLPPLPPPPPPDVPMKPTLVKSLPTLKALQWDKVESLSAENVWNEMQNDLVINEEEVRNLFGQKVSHLATPRAVIFEGLLDRQRCQNLEIYLSRSKGGQETIKKGLEEAKLLEVDTLRRLIPTEDILVLIKDSTGDLGVAESFLKAIYMPHLDGRLQAMAYQMTFQEDLEVIKPGLVILKDALTQVKHSDRFKRVLEVVLVLGNTLNKGSFRGDAKAFRITSLWKIRDTKGLAEYIVKLLVPGDIDFIDDMKDILDACKVPIKSVEVDVMLLRNGLDRVTNEIRIQEDLPFKVSMNPFVKNSELELKSLEVAVEGVVVLFKDTLAWFGEDYESLEPETFFSSICEFSKILKNVEVVLSVVENTSLGEFVTGLEDTFDTDAQSFYSAEPALLGTLVNLRQHISKTANLSDNRDIPILEETDEIDFDSIFNSPSVEIELFTFDLTKESSLEGDTQNLASLLEDVDEERSVDFDSVVVSDSTLNRASDTVIVAPMDNTKECHAQEAQEPRRRSVIPYPAPLTIETISFYQLFNEPAFKE